MKFCIYLTIITNIFILSTKVNSHTYEKMGIEIIHPWCSPSKKEGNSICNLTIANNTENPISLTNIHSNDIGHIMIMKNDNPAEKIVIPANGIRTTDDFSLMLHGTKKDLIKGENSSANLEFDNGMTINIRFVIGEDTMLIDNKKNDKKHSDHGNHH